MRVFTCESDFDSIMTCIYDAWEWALKNGHENMRIEREPIMQMTLFDEYVHIDRDREKSDKVASAILKKISREAAVWVYYVTLHEKDHLDDIYRFLRVGFKEGKRTTQMLSIKPVITMERLSKTVGNEIHYGREFLRFDSMEDKVFVAHTEPKADTIFAVSQHFADRMPSENWLIVDDGRKKAVVHPKDEEIYVIYLTDEQLEELKQTEKNTDIYRDMWRTFFDAIAIKERENYKCQRTLFPIWMRKHVTEFM